MKEETTTERPCGLCGDMVPEGDVEVIGDVHLCRPCAESAYECDVCGEVSHIDDTSMLYPGDSGAVRLCEACLDQYYRCCDYCGDWYSTERTEFPTCCTCEYCYRDQQEGLIHEWDYRPYLRFIATKEEEVGEQQRIGTLTYFLGLELETDYVRPYQVANAVGMYMDNLFCKSDGSLADGVEIVSHPGTLKAWQNGLVIPWDDWHHVEDLTGSQKRERSAGVHVHVSRTAFTRKGKWSASHLWRFMQLHYRNRGAFQYLSGRDASTYARWNTVRDRPLAVDDAKAGNGNQGERYRIINVQNQNTVECRYFQADATEEGILKNLELVAAAVEYTRFMNAKDVREGALDWRGFFKFLKGQKKAYPHLHAFAANHREPISRKNLDTQARYEEVREESRRQERERVALRGAVAAMLGIDPRRDSSNYEWTIISGIETPGLLADFLRGRNSRAYRHEILNAVVDEPEHIASYVMNDFLNLFLNYQGIRDRYYARIDGDDMDTRRTQVAAIAWTIVRTVEEVFGIPPELHGTVSFQRLFNRNAEAY